MPDPEDFNYLSTIDLLLLVTQTLDDDDAGLTKIVVNVLAYRLASLEGTLDRLGDTLEGLADLTAKPWPRVAR